MKKGIADFAKRLTSRKFLLTVGTVAGLAAAKEYNTIIYIVLGYLASEGSSDVVTAYTQGKATAEQIKQNTDLITAGVMQPPDAVRDVDRPIVPGQ